MKNISKLPVKYNGEIVGYTEDEGKTIKFIKETDTLSYDICHFKNKKDKKDEQPI